MAGTLAHRGPDDSGFFVDERAAMGFRRLSIIDLYGGHQPMTDSSGRWHIIFNGEIYNFQSIRSELESAGQRFSTKSDTEVILRCYELFGERCVERLNGMFAFAIWDSQQRKLFLARDRVGKKPLYYYVDGSRLIFASELKAILSVPGVDVTIDPSALDNYFEYQYVPEPASILSGVRKLPPAHTLTVENGTVRERRYWEVPAPPTEYAAESELVEELLETLKDAVRIRMISDVPLGVFLSGGLDSSAVTALMATMSDRPVKTFSIKGGEGEFNELPFAKAVADMYATDHHEGVIDLERLDTLLPRLIRHFDEPFADSSMIPTYYVSRMARENVTVALSGEGGDELFAGYDWHRTFLKRERYRRTIPRILRSRLLPKVLPDSSLPATATGGVARLLRRASIANRLSLGDDADAYQALITSPPHFKSLAYSDQFRSSLARRAGASGAVGAARAYRATTGGNLLARALQTDFEVYLPGDLLTKVDRMSMANSLEVRSPLLDYRLVELAARIPSRLKLKAGVRKYILRQSVNPLLPPIVRNRTDKRGFSVPVTKWFRGSMSQYARDVLLDDSFLGRGFVNGAGVEQILERHRNGSLDYGPQIWSLLMFALWLETVPSARVV